MKKLNILQKDYTINGNFNQLKNSNNLNIECMIPANDSVRLLSQLVEEMDLSELYSTYSRIRENSVTPRQMLKIVLYSYMEHKYSTRNIEKSCKRDINFMFLLEGRPAPDHASIGRFRSLHFGECSEKILAQITGFLFSIGEISGENIFIDGTKIEANANKYTFVWKKSTIKNEEKLFTKITNLFSLCEEMYGIYLIHDGKIKMKHMKKLRRKLYGIKREEGIEFVYGSGKRKNAIQKSIEELEEYIEKLKEYTKKLYICGDRNSYSKTDNDATFMRMKEDAMRNGQLKAGYNVQHGVDAEYISWVTVGKEPADTTRLIPFIKSMEENLYFKYRRIIADAGYESEENYEWIKGNDQISYIKPSNYEISKTRKYKNDISKIDNMEYHGDEDYYICKNGKKLTVEKVTKRKSSTGYESEKTIYVCEDCNGCAHKEKCIKGKKSKTAIEDRTKRLETSKLFNEQRKESLERITSDEGCQLRMNRSIQVEGSFGVIKQDMGFRRYLCRGKKNVLAETILLAIAYNINKLHNKIQGNRTGKYLHELKENQKSA